MQLQIIRALGINGEMEKIAKELDLYYISGRYPKDVEAAYIFGSFARGKEHLWSDIDLIIVKDSSLPFIERPREFFDPLDIGVPLDILVYTQGDMLIGVGFAA